MLHVWWFICWNSGHLYLEKQSPKGPSLDSAPKVHKSSILHEEFYKENKIWKTWFGIHVFSFFLGTEILLRSMGNPSAKPTVWPRIAYFVNMEVRSIFGDSSVEILVTYIIEINHQRVQVWIQHQKFTNRAFYIKSFIKSKSIWKTWFGIHVFSFFLGSEILLRSMGNLVPNQRFDHE